MTRPAQPVMEQFPYKNEDERKSAYHKYYETIQRSWGRSYIMDGKAIAVRETHYWVNDQYQGEQNNG